MNLQEQLTKNHARSWLSNFLRMLALIMLPLAQIVMSKMKEDYNKSKISPFQNTLFESIKVILLNILVIFQTSVGIPEIDSQGEEIRLKSLDKPISYIMLLFNIAKLSWDYFPCRYPELLSFVSVINTSKIIMTDCENITFNLYFNLVFIGGSLICIYSSAKFNFVIKQSSKKKLRAVLSNLMKILRFTLICTLCAYTFFTDNEIASVLILGLVLFSVYKLLIEMSSEKKAKISLEKYAKYLKIIIVSMITIVSFIKISNREEMTKFVDSHKSTALGVVAGVVLALQHTSILNLEQILLMLQIYLYIKEIYRGTKMDFFDVELAGDQGKYYLYLSEWEDGQDIEIDSHTSLYFLKNILAVFKLSEEEVFTGQANYKIPYLVELQRNSKIFSSELTIIQENYIERLSKRGRLRIMINKTIKWVRHAAFVKIMSKRTSILMTIISGYCCWSFLFHFYGDGSKRFHFLRYALLYWNICAMVVQDAQAMKYVTMIFIYPFYAIDCGLVVYEYVKAKYVKSNPNIQLEEAITFTKYLNAYLKPLGNTEYLIVFVLVSIYTIISLRDLKKNSNIRNIDDEIRKKRESRFQIHDIDSKMDSKIKTVLLPLFRAASEKGKYAFRYIPLFLAMGDVFYSVNILNVILLIMVLFLIWFPEYDRVCWPYFMRYCFFILVLKYVGNELFPIRSFNIEIIAMIGITTIEEKTNKTLTYSFQLMFLFILCYFAAVRYRWIVREEEAKKEEEKISQRRKRHNEIIALEYKATMLRGLRAALNILQDFFSDYMVWAYHIFFNLILVYDQSDIFSTILFVSEIICIVFHVILWNSKKSSSWKWISRIWYFNFFLVFVYCLARYILFFLKYSMLNFYIVRNPVILMWSFFFISQEIITKNQNFVELNYIARNYFAPLLLLYIGVLTRRAFRGKIAKQTKINEVKQALNISSDESNKLKGSTDSYKASNNNNEDSKGDKSSNLEFWISSAGDCNLNSKKSIFIIGLLLLKGLFYYWIIGNFSINVNLFKVVTILMMSINYQTIICGLLTEMKVMHFYDIMSLMVKYFYSRFIKARHKSKASANVVKTQTKEEYIEMDSLLRKSYYHQFMLKLERSLMANSKVYWTIIFCFALIYSLMLKVYTFFFFEGKSPTKDSNKEEVSELYRMITGLDTKNMQKPELKSEMLSIQLFIIGCLVEYIFIHYFHESSGSMKELPNDQLENMITFIKAKYVYLIGASKKNYDSVECQDNYNSFIKAQKCFQEMVAILLNNEVSEATSNEHLVDKSSPSKGSPAMDKDISDIFSNLSLSLEMRNKKEASNKKNLHPSKTKRRSIFAEIGKKLEFHISFAVGLRNLYEKSKIDDNEEDEYWLFDVFFNRYDNDKEKCFEVKLTELVDKEKLLLFLWQNKNKYFFIRILKSMTYGIKILTLWPALYGITGQLNLSGILFVSYFFVSSLKLKSKFTDNLGFTSYIVLAYMSINVIHLYLHNCIHAKEVNILIYSDMVKNQGFFSILLHPMDNSIIAVNSIWMSLIFLGFATIPIIVFYATVSLFEIKVKKNDIFHKYLYNRERSRFLVIDYKKWRNRPLRLTNFLHKYVYIETLEIHNIVTITVLLLLKTDQNIASIVMLSIGFIVSFYDHFRKMSKQIIGIDILQGKKNLIHVFNIFFWTYWICFIMAQINLLLAEEWLSEGNTSEFNPHIRGLSLLILTLACRNIAAIDNYPKMRSGLKKEGMLKKEFAALCMAYEHNEDKIYSRLTQMMSKEKMDEMSEALLNYKETTNFELDLNYSQQNIVDILKRRMNQFRNSTIGSFSTMILEYKNWIYNYLQMHSHPYKHYDLLYLHSLVMKKNQKLLDNPDIEVEDYFDNKFEYFSSRLKSIKLCYNLLAEKDASKMEKYEAEIHEALNMLKQKASIERIEELEEKGDQEETVINLEYKKQRDKKNLREIGFQSLRFAQIKQDSKPTEYLDSAAHILFDILSKTTNSEESGNMILEVHEQIHRNNGYIHCKYGNDKVYLYNVVEDISKETQAYNIINLRILLKLFIKSISSNIEMLFSLVLIILQIRNGGLTNIVIIYIIVFKIYIEENLGRSIWWKILYLIFLAELAVKVFAQTEAGKTLSTPEYYEFFVGTLEVKLFPILPIMFLIEYLKRQGFNTKTLSQFENPGMAMARLILNKDLNGLIDRKCDRAERMDQMNVDHILSREEKKLNKVDFARLKLESVKFLIKNYGLMLRFKKNCKPSYRRLVRLMQNEIYSIHDIDLENFYYRNFSNQIRKKGGNYFIWIGTVLIICCLYILLAFPRMDYKKDNDLSILNAHLSATTIVDALTVLNLIIYLAFLLLEYIFFRAHTNDLLGFRSHAVTTNLLSLYNFDAIVTKKPETMIDKFRQVARQVKFLVALERLSKRNPLKTFNTSPDFIHYSFLMIAWIYMNISVFFWHAYNSNWRKEHESYLHKFVCTKEEVNLEVAEGILKCRSYADNYYSQIFYLLNTIYFLLAILQLKAGKSFNISARKDFSKLINKAKYYALALVPMVRETTTTLEYCAIHTCLHFSDFLLLNDIQMFMDKASMRFLGKRKNPVGKPISRIGQVGTGLLVVVSLIIAITIPFFIFSNSQSFQSHDILEGSFSIELIQEDNRKIVDLFKSDKILLNVKEVDSEEIKKEFYEQGKLFSKFHQSRFKKIEFSLWSDEYLNITPKTLTNLQNMMKSNITASIHTTIRINVIKLTNNNRVLTPNIHHRK